METPVADFVRAYVQKDPVRLHMPGHKGRPFLGPEPWDITEIPGADSLYEAEGILAESEANAASLFGAGRTLYSAEGSSQCIRAMVRLAISLRASGTLPVIAAPRNVHKAFVYACALLDVQVQWLWPRQRGSLCACPLSAQDLEEALDTFPVPPAAVYITSPDYLGHQADIGGMAQVCRKRGIRLLVDNAHGAYLHFLPEPCHPLDLGADLCCDSAHKTLPVLTGGAYMHLKKGLPDAFYKNAREAMALFGSTSPSYLILSSLDLCNRYLAGECRQDLACWVQKLDALKARLEQRGWGIEPGDPLRLTLLAPRGWSGHALGEQLRRANMEYEYADGDFLVLMTTPQNGEAALSAVEAALGEAPAPPKIPEPMALTRPKVRCSLREGCLGPQERVPAAQALGRICAAPAVSCPPAVPIVLSGEEIGPEEIAAFHRYGIEQAAVLREQNI